MAQLTSEEYRKRSKSLLEQNKLDEALECINEGLKKGSDDELMRYKGEVFTKLGKLNEALECYNKISIPGILSGAAFGLVAFPIGGIFLLSWIHNHDFSPGAWSNILELFLDIIGVSLIIGGPLFFVITMYQRVRIIRRKRDLQKRIEREKLSG